MDTPTRRDLFKYAVGATLSSALPVSAQIHKDTTQWPLVVDLSGPMAFECGNDAQHRNIIDVWLPHLEQIDEHEAGIVTPSLSFPLTENEYTITGPSYSSNEPTPYPTFGCTVYPAQTTLNANRTQNKFIRLTLPMPSLIVAMHPVQAKVYNPPTAPSGLDTLATGLRFVYDTAGTVILTPAGNNPEITQFDFDPAGGEKQLHMSIEYAPFNSRDPDYAKAGYVFTELAMLFLNLRLKVSINEQKMAGQSKRTPTMFGSPLHPCKGPIIFQS